MSARRSSLLAFGLSLLLTSVTAGAVDPSQSLAVPGDFNADGRQDVLYQPLQPGGRGAIVLQDSTGQLTVVAQDWDPGYLGLDWSIGASTLTAADLNGDGQDDVLAQPVQAGGTAALVLTDPTVRLLQISQLLPAGYLGLDWSSATHAIVVGDFDGDHHKELLLLGATPGTAGALVHTDAAGHLVAVMQPIADGFLGRHWNARDEALYVGDFNGDGREDLLVQSRHAVAGESAYALLLADGDGRFSHLAETWNLKDLGADWDPATHRIVIEDANHDGIMDITLRATDGSANYLFEGNPRGLITQPSAHWTGSSSASDALSKARGNKVGTGISVVASPTGVTTDSITVPTNPEQDPTIPTGALGFGSGQIMTANAAGTLEGSGGVSGGTATYSIPIIVPPGRAGMQPSVSLSYSSRGGNGSMGMGWSLNAGSEIHRCPATLAMDGYAKGVTYGSADRLCLDGQHLVLVSGSYGADGAQYRTELDSFVRVTEHGAMSDSTSHFTVDRKDGHEMRYGWGSNIGSSPNAVFTPSGAPAPLAWGLGMEVDTYNNSIIYYYSTFGAGEYLLTSIQYTGSGATAGNREVDFSYGDRSDISSQYLAGGLTQQTHVLSRIRTMYNGQLVRTYNTDYSTSQATGRTILKGLQECAGLGPSKLCLPETTFSWHGPTTAFDDPVPMDADKFCSIGDSDNEADPNDLVWQFSSPGDLNGDGRRDLIMYRQDCGARAYFAKAGGGFGPAVDLGQMFSAYLPADQTATDMDGDGIAELVGPTSTGWGYTRLKSTGDAFDDPTSFSHTGNGITAPDMDVDGDGLPDLVSIEPDPDYPGYHRLAVYLNTTTPCSGCAHRTISISGTATVLYRAPDNDSGNASFVADSLGDMNGDGLPDFDLETPINHNVTTDKWLFVRTDNQGHMSGQVATVTGPVGKGYTLDINGDGLPDKVYQCSDTNTDWCYVLNTGDMGDIYTAEVDTGVTDNVDSGYIPGIAAGNVAHGVLEADLDGDGIQELVYPGVLMADYCVIEHKGTDEMVTQCANAGGSGPDLGPNFDLSIYQYRRTKFVWGPDANGVDKYMPQSAATSIVAQNNTSIAMDVDGDGLTDIISSFTKMHLGDTFQLQPGFTDWSRPVGPHYVSNSSSSSSSKNAAIDLMVSATNGLGVVTQWNYYPLSSNKAYNGLDLYDAPAIGDADRRNAANYNYFYFDSSMYVVGDFSTSDGVGGMREHDFHYGPAIYSSQGRGFQGFRTVVDDDMTSGARTVQVYHQHFPLSGMSKESWVTTQDTAVDLVVPVPVTGTYIKHTVNTWGCMSRSTMTVDGISCSRILDAPTFVPALQQTVDTKYDLQSHDLLATTTTRYCAVSSAACNGFGYDLYGNSLGIITTTSDAAGTYISTMSSSYPAADQDVPDWWVNKLKETTTTVQANYGNSTGAVVTRDTTFDYYSDGTRGLNHSYAHADGSAANEVDTHYTYANGNVTSVTVSGGSGATAVTARTTATTYSTGDDPNYFPVAITDPTGLVTSSVYDGRYGKPSSVTAADGVTTASTYDAFGRPASTQVGSLPAQTVSYITHTSGDGMCDSTSAATAYYVLTHQDGYPDHYACFDMLSRSIRTATESLVDGAALIYQSTVYNARGQVTGVKEPRFNDGSAPTVWNHTSYYGDILGRVKTKTDAKGVQTAYYYNEDTSQVGGYQQNQVRIQTLADGTERDDLETRNSQGKLLSVQNLTNVPGQTTTTSYAYDSDGNPTTITAADGNAINASFDVLGHKLSVSDPDQGTTAYTYDVLGELLTQTDAKGQTLTMSYDPDGRMLSKSSNVSGEVPVSWTYDSCNHGAGKPCSVTQSDGTTIQYQENYDYDSLGRVKTDEEVIDGVAYDTDTTYDADGRVDTVTYPDSIMDSAPTVSVGGTIYALPNSDVALNATVTDPDGGIDTPGYRWVQTAGGAVTINDGSTTNADFVTGGLGTSYTFQFTADDGVLGNSASVTVNVPDVPAAPGGLTDSGDTNNDGTYTVAWNAVTDTGTTITYHLEEAAGTSSGPTGGWTEIYAGGTASTTVSHPGNGAYYYWYRVRAEAKISGTSLGFSDYSGTLDRIHLVVTPGAPSGIFPTVASTSTGSYNITWGARTGVVVLSKVFYELDESINTGWTGASVVYSGTAQVKSFSKTDLQDYYYRVRACNQDGNVKVCSDWTGRAHEIITGTGGGGQQQQQIQAPTSDGTAAPAPATGGIGMVVPALLPLNDDQPKALLAVVRHPRENGDTDPDRLASIHDSLPPEGEGQGMRVHASGVRPHFAPPLYKAWADAHMTAATGGGTTARFAVKHIYSATGYLMELAEAANPDRVYWQINQFAGGTSGGIDSAGQFYLHGMNAYGQPTHTFSGGGTVVTHYGYDPNTDYLMSINSTGGGNTYQDEHYTWAAVGNLTGRTSNPNVNSPSVLSESFQYDLNNRLTSSQVTNGSGTQAPVTYGYDAAGNITCKSDVVNHDCSTTPTGYDYTVTSGVPGGPHAVKTAGSNTYAYDADGNMTNRAGTNLDWNSDGLPTCIDTAGGHCAGTNYSQFSYAPDKHRYKQVAMAAGVPTTTVYAGGMQIITTGTTTTYEVTLSAYGRSVVMEDLTNSGTNAQGKKSVLLTDHLGSVDTVVDVTNATPTVQGQSFDTFGKRRNAGSWQGGSGGTGTSSQHGFTDHEQLDNVGLVHMNGRVYDPNVGRFLSVDPVFQAPTNGQSVNPYSYVMNNPLSLTDPSGYTAVVDNNGGSGPDTAPLQAVVGDSSTVTADASDVDKFVKTSDDHLVAVLHDGTQIDVTQITLHAADGSTGSLTKDAPGIWSPSVSGPTNENQGSGSTNNTAPTQGGGNVSLESQSSSAAQGTSSANQGPTLPKADKEEVFKYVLQQADAYHVPEDLALGVVAQESYFDTSALNKNSNGSIDWGVMEINDRNFGKSTKDADGKSFIIDGGKVISDWKYNVQVGLSILRADYQFASKRLPPPYDRTELMQGTYGRYNGSYKDWSNFDKPGTPLYRNVQSFMNKYMSDGFGLAP